MTKPVDEAERKHLRTRVRSIGVMARVVKQLSQAEADSPELLAERERFVQAVLAITSRVAPGSNAWVRTGLTSAKPVSPKCDGNAEG